MHSALNIRLNEQAQEDLAWWQRQQPKTAQKILRMFDEMCVTPYQGLGKPEPLRHEYAGWWSRRITKEHRLVYKVEGDTILITQCRFHY